MACDQYTQHFLDAIYGRYGHLSATALLEMTHQEPPWRDAMANMVGSFITTKTMKAFFGGLLTCDAQFSKRLVHETRPHTPTRDQPDVAQARPSVIASVKKSLRHNAAVWAELAKY